MRIHILLRRHLYIETWSRSPSILWIFVITSRCRGSPICYYLRKSTTTVPLPMHHVLHDDVIKWKHLPRYWPFVRGIHWSPDHTPHKGQWRKALMFSLICVWINGWVNNRATGNLRRHYDVIVMWNFFSTFSQSVSWSFQGVANRKISSNLMPKTIEFVSRHLVAWYIHGRS